MSNFWWGMFAILIILMSNIILIIYICYCRLPRVIDNHVQNVVIGTTETNNNEVIVNEIEINPPNVVVIECPNNNIYVGIKLESN